LEKLERSESVVVARSWIRASALLGLLLVSAPFQTSAQEGSSVASPVEHVYAVHDGAELKAYVFSPVGQAGETPRSAILVFHGGGWHIGAAEWAFGRART
jgi:acetyl esterase/lipase